MAEISIIVPVYNVEKYIRRCIDSLITQTFKSIEILLIDDGSKDSSGAICDEYALKDGRIKAIHKKNGGVSSARNVGLDNATGAYIMFCDSDDYVDPTWCEKLYNSIIKRGFYSACGYAIVNGEGEMDLAGEAPHFRYTGSVSTDSERLLFLYNHGLFRMIWNAIFKLSIIRTYGIRFREEYSRCEDTLFAIEYLLTKEGNIGYIEEKLYFYTREIADSLTNRIPHNYWNGELSWLRRIRTLMYAYDIDFISYSNKYYSQVLYAVLTALNGITSEQEELKTLLKRVKKVFRTPECKDALKNGDFSDINTVYTIILRTRSSFLVWIFHHITRFKHRYLEP